MGFDIQKHGPILAVLGVAFYLGWPPAELEDYGAGPVKAKAVRWKVADLVQPRLPSSLTGDPFAEVLINPSSETVPTNTESNPVKTEAPSGPTKQDFLEGLKLGGVAEAKSNRWAIINGRIRREGDQVKVIGLRNQFATIDRIEVNRVVVSLAIYLCR